MDILIGCLIHPKTNSPLPALPTPSLSLCPHLLSFHSSDSFPALSPPLSTFIPQPTPSSLPILSLSAPTRTPPPRPCFLSFCLALPLPPSYHRPPLPPSSSPSSLPATLPCTTFILYFLSFHSSSPPPRPPSPFAPYIDLSALFQTLKRILEWSVSLKPKVQVVSTSCLLPLQDINKTSPLPIIPHRC